MDIELIINRLKEILKTDKIKDVAEYLEVKPNTLSSWKARNTIDYELIFSKCDGVNFQWLLTGKGSMFVEGVPNNNPITLRIIDVTLHFNISYDDFCSSIGRDSKNKGNWYYEFTDVELKNIILVYKINPLWLLTGEGEMIDKNNVDENELKELRQENSRLKDKIIALLENNTGQNKKINKAV